MTQRLGNGLFCLLFMSVLLSGCQATRAAAAQIEVKITNAGASQMLKVPAGSSVQQALAGAKIPLGALDRTEPPLYTTLTEGMEIRVVRVKEAFENEQVVIPFERQVLYNESLPKDRQIILQKGQNGTEEITYRQVYEDGIEISEKPIPTKINIISQPLSEIIMIGIQNPFVPISLPGRLIYLRDGNVWSIVDNTSNRLAIITSGDLDGRVFSLSFDDKWLLFSRRWEQKRPDQHLVGSQYCREPSKLIDLKIANVVQFADWIPGSNTRVIFSTVEARPTAPGWQANNDLNTLTFSNTGWTTKWSNILEANSGGVYGWWGTNFTWSPEGRRLAYARPDTLGILDLGKGSKATVMDLIPLQTHSDWAWVPGFSWSPDGMILYSVDHVKQPGSGSPEESQDFDLVAFSIEAGRSMHLVSQVGMFAYPIVSPPQKNAAGEIDYQVAYLQAIFPNQSETSHYRLSIINRDGSKDRALFPRQDEPGLEPQRDWGAWSPEPMPGDAGYAIAVIYQGNLWLVNSSSGQAQQVTGDGLTTRVIWK